MTEEIYLAGEKGNKIVEGRLRVIQPIGILREDFSLGYLDHSTITVIKDVDGKVLSESPDLVELQSSRIRSFYDNNLLVIPRGIKILERLPELRDHTLYAAYLLACESDKRFEFTVRFGKAYKPGVKEIERLRRFLGPEVIMQIFSSIPEDLEGLVKVLMEKRIPFETDCIREVVKSGQIQVGDCLRAALARDK